MHGISKINVIINNIDEWRFFFHQIWLDLEDMGSRMVMMVPSRAALGLAATLLVSTLALEARAEDASPWQRDSHSAVRLLAGSRSGAGALFAIQVRSLWMSARADLTATTRFKRMRAR